MCGLGAGDPDPFHPGLKVRLVLGHIIDKSKGGPDTPGNLRAVTKMKLVTENRLKRLNLKKENLETRADDPERIQASRPYSKRFQNRSFERTGTVSNA
jgi:hypothetical protein